MLSLVKPVRRILEKMHSPDGYNIGLNVEAAGQTVGHVHPHVIPRFSGDAKLWRLGKEFVNADPSRLAELFLTTTG
jgi:diadenosine tetraphosphate (Ap4A) HIT family hydrolase